MGIEWADSAAKWNISQEDALYAIHNAVYASANVKLNGGNPATARRVLIGPQHSQTDRLIEVLIELRPGGFWVYHVMPLGPYYKRQMEDDK